jgi:hypothetical protein
MRSVTIILITLFLVFADYTRNFEPLFNARIDYGTNEESTMVFASDFDSDGFIDLAVSNTGSSDISILLNNGNGTYQSAVNYPTGGSEPWSVFAADFDGDGDNDLAAANIMSDNVSILLNNGDGTFQTAVTYDTGDRPESLYAIDPIATLTST